MPNNKHQHQDQSKQGDFALELTDHFVFYSSHTASSLPGPTSLSEQQKASSK